MPLYEYQCPDGHVTRELRTVDLRSAPARCTVCGNDAQKVILSAPRVFGDFAGYESPASGRWIEGRRARRDDFERTGTRPFEEGDHEVAARNRKAIAAKQEAWADEIVEKTAAEMGIRS